ncbi:class I SAM-dependent methyltransferase [Aporhodopirellula aestuarii]|uniref:Class I SAM-dependent methyltransferase n=1 Tax=Aporhodopirellula aestuarii TaxID=2950107 RepID=A0ABT0UF36_9BACT|nr:class I SAM-dependent methyltransferase [Aporhodopirellula aestuarii]MCM2374995.1 class I SAM-dependent methyltransferase [Aporhodopirellula aestuarii]
MSSHFSYLSFARDAMVYGPSYGLINQLTRISTPLDPEAVWDATNRVYHPTIEWFRKNYPPAFMRKLLMWRKMRQAHAKGITQHYDVSNDFYKIMLDKKYMFYSCADFLREEDTLEDAQTNKANAILDLLQPKAGERILELGSGWGAMLRVIRDRTGDSENLYGYTLSNEQYEHNQATDGFNVELNDFITCEYPTEKFDAIYSIGAWEHVRPHEIDPLLKKLHRALVPGGRMVKHFFCLPTDHPPVSTLTAQLCFPGSQLASHHFHVQAFERAGFRIVRQTVSDYRPTIKAWFDNLVTNQDAAIEAGGIYHYNRYLTFCAMWYRFFQDGEANLFRFQLVKR